jgi:predicted SAM-dependent methyltransferase
MFWVSPKKTTALRHRNLARVKKSGDKIKLDICGGIKPYHADFNNIDIQNSDFVDFTMDVARGIDFPDSSIDEIVSIATLEHFNFQSMQQVLCEMTRVLKTGGKISIATPDIEKIASHVLKADFLQNYENINNNIYALQRDEYDIHRCAISSRLLKNILIRLGFGQFQDEDSSLRIEHDVELSCRVSAIKLREVPYFIEFSKYKPEHDNLLWLSQQDKFSIYVNEEKKGILPIYIPENRDLRGQKIEILHYGAPVFNGELTQGLNQIDILPFSGFKYIKLDLKFTQAIKPNNELHSKDLRTLAASIPLSLIADTSVKK